MASGRVPTRSAISSTQPALALEQLDEPRQWIDGLGQQLLTPGGEARVPLAVRQDPVQACEQLGFLTGLEAERQPALFQLAQVRQPADEIVEAQRGRAQH